jgi:uncharacterized membrane protein YozB (DUF420 family)
MDVRDLPTLNAALNASASVLLALGWWSIKKQQNPVRHRNFMLAALVCSALFLSSYLYYHYHAGSMTPYRGTGLLRTVYFFILFTHIPLAGLIVPFVLAAVWFALRGQFQRHVRITRYLLPTWLYVSITGVLVYVFLYVLPQP